MLAQAMLALQILLSTSPIKMPHPEHVPFHIIHIGRCVFPSINPRLRFLTDVVNVTSAPEGTVISFSCNNENQVLDGIDNATCIEGRWSPDIDGVTCRGK